MSKFPDIYGKQGKELAARASSEWFLPDFFSDEDDPAFVAHISHLAASFGSEQVGQEELSKAANLVFKTALYTTNFCMPVSYKNQLVSVKFITGHLWEGKIAGPAPARVMVLSKTPGGEDSDKGRNFISSSGRLLKQQFNEIGVDVDDWYITNLVRFATPPNFSGALPKPWIKMCRRLLRAELALVQPDFILCLGGEVAKELFNTSVDRAYGNVFDYTFPVWDGKEFLNKTAKAIVSIHPSALAKKADKLNQFQLSLRQFKDLVETGNSVIEETGLNYYTVNSEYELNSLVSSILAEGKPKMVAFDAEWYGRRPEDSKSFLRCYQFSWKAKHAVVVALHNSKGEPTFQGDPYRPLARLFIESGARPVGHNIKADVMWLGKGLKDAGYDIEANLYPPQYGLDLGPPATRTEGAFDTMLAAHAIRETGPFELEALGVLYLGIPRWDNQVKLTHDNKVPFGYMPDEVLYPYAAKDACVTFRLAELFNGEWSGNQPENCIRQGYLDSDPVFKLDSRRHFWISMMALSSFMEMEQRGILFDAHQCIKLREVFLEAKERVLNELRTELSWPLFNPNSVNHKREFLFGEKMNGKKPDANGEVPRIRPEGALSLYLTPLKTSGKPALPWSKVIEEKKEEQYSPSTAKDTMGVFAHTTPLVKKLMDYSFVNQALNTALRAPSEGNFLALDTPDEVEATETEDVEEVSQKGLMDYVCEDNAIHSIYWQTKETGRASASKPNLMAISKKRDKDYARIVGPEFRPIRSLFIARPGYLLVEGDFIGAELAMMAMLSGDETMIDHVRRSGLPDDHPDHFDIHSNFASSIFKLGLPPKKSALEAAGKKTLRDAVKCVVEGSRLHTSGGLLRVESVVGSGVGVDEHLVYSGDLKVVNHKSSTPIVAVYNGGMKPCVRVGTDSGYQLDNSINHRYWVMGPSGDMIFKRAEELSLGDYVAVRMQEGPFGDNVMAPSWSGDEKTSFKDISLPEEFDEDWAALLGLYIAEGSANPESGMFQLVLANEADAEFAEAAERLFNKLFADRLRASDVAHETYQDQRRFVINSVKLCRWLSTFCPSGSHTISIPDFVFSWPKRLIVPFLRWMFEGDGSAKKNGKGFTIQYSTASENLARDTHLLLSMFGILANLSWEKREGYEGKYWTVTLVSNEAREKFCKEIGFVTKTKNDRCVSTTPYKLDPRVIPGQVDRLRRLLPYIASPTKEKCRECVRENSRVSLNRSRLQLILSAVDTSKLQGEVAEDFAKLTELASWDVSFQAVELVEDLGMRQVYDVQTTPEYDHLVSYNGIMTHQTLTFGIPYGRGMEAVVVAVKEESGLEISVTEAEKIRDGIFETYPKLREFLERTKNRVVKPGYLRDNFGGLRRFTLIGDDRKSAEDAKREAGNFRIQGSVARAMSLGLYNLRAYRRHVEPQLDYYILNQIHDAAISECAVQHVERFVEHVLPTCLSKAVKFYAVDDDGKRVSDRLFSFDLDVHVYERWGIDLTHDDCDRLGISRKFGKAPRPKK